MKGMNMERYEVERAVLDAVRGEVEDPGIEVNLDSRLEEDLLLSSLSMAAVSFNIEDVLGLAPSDSSFFKEVVTVQDLVTAILSSLSEMDHPVTVERASE